MSQAAQIDLSALTERVEGVLREHSGVEVSIGRVVPLIGGACQDNVRIDCHFPEGDLAGDRRLVIRSDPPNALPGSLGRREELAVIEAAVAAGVPTPTARWLTPDLLREGAWAYFMDFAPGVAIGRKVVSSPELEGARRRLPGQLAAALTAVHTVNPNETELSFSNFLPATEVGPAASQNAFARSMLEAIGEPHPAAELALQWLEENEPKDESITLVHADFRTGNFMVTPDGLAALLDWEFAHWGNPMEDIAWIALRDWRFGVLDRPIGGFAERASFYDAYEQASGRPVNREHVRYWEVSGNLRWGLGCAFQGHRYLSGKRSDLELIAIARRSCEMEYEALRLIDSVDKGAA